LVSPLYPAPSLEASAYALPSSWKEFPFSLFN
jgi:hypothetical protein